MMKTTQDTIRQLRENRQWSQEEMAEKLGMSKNGYAKIERGESDLSLTRLEQIANIFQINISDIIKNTDRDMAILIGDNNQSIIQNSHNPSQVEFEKLELIIAHKDELLTQKEKEIEALKQIISLLQKSEQK